MENIGKFLMVSLGSIMFVIAVSIFMRSDKEINKTINMLKNNKQNEDVISMYDYEIGDKNKVSYSQLIAILMNELDTDIQIGSLEFKKDTYKPLNFNFSISVKDYTKSYEYDDNGNIKKVVYK